MNKKYDSEKNSFLLWWFVIPAVLVVAAVLYIMFFVDSVDDLCSNWYCKLFGNVDKLELIKIHGWILAGFLSVVAVMAANRRSDALTDQVKIALSGNRQERFRDAVNHLGNESSSVRQSGFHSLFHLALGDEELRPAIASILCAHIRETTNQEDYRRKHITAPSEEIQSLLDLLFKAEILPKEKQTKIWGFIPKRKNTIISQNKQRFWSNLTPDLSKGYLPGARILNAQLQGANLSGAQLQGALLIGAQLQGALITETNLQGAQLTSAQLQGAWLIKAQLQDAWLIKAQLQGTMLIGAQLQRAYLRDVQLQGADLEDTQLQGANLKDAQLQGANLMGAQLQEANLKDTQLQGVVSYNSTYLTKTFCSIIQDRVGKNSDFSTVVFAEGVGTLGTSHQPPDVAITGRFDEKEAKKWITKYEKAMATVPASPYRLHDSSEEDTKSEKIL